ncbi:hypothetical protein V2G26_012223 [Clonostachys chloroleuca]
MFRSINLARTLSAIFLTIQPVKKLPTPILRLKYHATSPLGGWSNGAKKADHIVYSNKYGEEILFDGQYPPLGYIFVPAGNLFITRHCRRLSKETEQKVYAYYRPRSKKKLAKQYGLYIPKAIFEKVKSQYDARKATAEQEWSQKLDKIYPHMPSKDKAEVQRLFSSPFLKSESIAVGSRIRRYVLDHYTEFQSLSCIKLDTEAAAKARQEADRILSTWRGKDLGI